MTRSISFAVSILFLILSTAVLSPAQEANAPSMEGTHFEITPYLLVPWMSGETTVKGTTVPIDASAGTILSNLQMGFMARTKLSYNRWFVGTDTVYMGLGRANDVIDVGFDQWAAELLSGYQVHKRIAVLGGVRYNSLSANIQFKGPGGPIHAARRFGGTRSSEPLGIFRSARNSGSPPGWISVDSGPDRESP